MAAGKLEVQLHAELDVSRRTVVVQGTEIRRVGITQAEVLVAADGGDVIRCGGGTVNKS